MASEFDPKHKPSAQNPEFEEQTWVEGTKRTGAILAVLSFAVFWSLRAVALTGGDSDQWCREIEQGLWWRKRQMLSFALMQLNYQWTHFLWQWDGRLAINLTSCMAGAAFVYGTWGLLGGEKRRWTALALVYTAGFMQLFFGHLETYACPMACMIFFLLAVRRYLLGQTRAIAVAGIYSLGIFFHLIFWFLFPLFAVMLWHSPERQRDARQFLYGLLPAVILTIWMFIDPYFGFGEMIGDRFMPLWRVEVGMKKHYAFFSWTHIFDWLWFIWNACHLQIFVVIIGIACKKLRRGKWQNILLAATLCFLIFTWIWHPDAKRLDWDLFSFIGLPIALMAVEVASQNNKRLWHTAIAITILISACFLMTKVIGAARLGARGEGMVIVQPAPDNRADISIIALDGHSKSREIHHVLEGAHEIRIYLKFNERVYRYDTCFELNPDQVITITVPDPEMNGLPSSAGPVPSIDE